jgi:hypothetical protein
MYFGTGVSPCYRGHRIYDDADLGTLDIVRKYVCQRVRPLYLGWHWPGGCVDKQAGWRVIIIREQCLSANLSIPIVNPDGRISTISTGLCCTRISFT